MDNESVSKLKNRLKELKKSVDKKTAAKLELDTWDSIINKINSFAPECEECSRHIRELDDYLAGLLSKIDGPEMVDYKQHKGKTDSLRTHLSKQHEIKTNGYYLSIFMCIGMAVGLLFGMAAFDNAALGLAFGVGIGVAVGAGLDEDARKKGRAL
ncbi:putative membrane protein YccC [Gracilibacillus halotolerans]|uniref:Putative membrane protein YccC n=1 Tax=Gracilibacillus halotolerans TaxID=74386 RepID=A0A841RQD6_9BACI|nr:hypothetical protein [Gracilibacillus halotolerans]MBB6513823.1 putative membrane protein YccC [Gracilibacillus halotolerans]